jgi:hypothetical protein
MLTKFLTVFTVLSECRKRYQLLLFLLKVTVIVKIAVIFRNNFLKLLWIFRNNFLKLYSVFVEMLTKFLTVFTVLSECRKLPLFPCFVEPRGNNRRLAETQDNQRRGMCTLPRCVSLPLCGMKLSDPWKIFHAINKHVLLRLFINKHFVGYGTSFVYETDDKNLTSSDLATLMEIS